MSKRSVNVGYQKNEHHTTVECGDGIQYVPIACYCMYISMSLSCINLSSSLLCYSGANIPGESIEVSPPADSEAAGETLPV